MIFKILFVAFLRRFFNLQQVIQAIKMKKYAYGTQMGSDGLQTANVVIKRQRSTRDVSDFIAPDDLISSQHFMDNNLFNLPPSFHQPLYNQEFSRIL